MRDKKHSMLHAMDTVTAPPCLKERNAWVTILEVRPCSSVDRALPSGGRCRRSSRRRGTTQTAHLGGFFMTVELGKWPG
jgi:hypothetical protein